MAESLVSQLLAVHIAMLSLAGLTVIIRLIVRKTMTDGGLGFNDYTICVSLAILIVFFAINVAQIQFGLGQHIEDIPKSTDFRESGKLFYFGEMLYYTTVGLTKCAIVGLYSRLIPGRKFRLAVWLTITMVLLTVFSCVVASIFQCTPVARAWYPALAGTCINRVGLYFANAGLDIFEDLVIYVLPLPVLYKLHLPLRKKVALMAVFIVGSFVVVTGILRLNSLKTAAVTDDPTWNNVAAANWSMVEASVAIFCASLVSLKPLISRFLPGIIDSAPDVSRRAPLTLQCSGYVRTGSKPTVEHEEIILIDSPALARIRGVGE